MTEMAKIRRIITGHDDAGKAIFVSDDQLTPFDPTRADGTPPSGRMVGFTTIHRTEGFPAKIQGPVPELNGQQIPLVSESGVTCRIVDFPASAGAEGDKVNIMHRTQSLDYGIVLKGSIKLVLDDGVETVMNEGDICVQRGTIHAWKNVSNENSRVLFVLVPAEEVKVQDTGDVLQSTDITHLLQPQGPIDQS